LPAVFVDGHKRHKNHKKDEIPIMNGFPFVIFVFFVASRAIAAIGRVVRDGSFSLIERGHRHR
jgi:hypothetical protein